MVGLVFARCWVLRDRARIEMIRFRTLGLEIPERVSGSYGSWYHF